MNDRWANFRARCGHGTINGHGLLQCRRVGRILREATQKEQIGVGVRQLRAFLHLIITSRVSPGSWVSAERVDGSIDFIVDLESRIDPALKYLMVDDVVPGDSALDASACLADEIQYFLFSPVA